MFQSQRFFPVFFMAVSVLIALASLVISNRLVKDLAREERNKMEIWATAAELLAKSEESSDMALVLKVLQTNTTIPVILFDESTGKLSSNNIVVPKDDYRHFLQKKKDEFAKKHHVASAILVSAAFRMAAHEFYKSVGFINDVRGFRKEY